MKYCNQCGGGLVDGARFCSSCGAPALTDRPKIPRREREESQKGAIHKCPYCGEPIESFSGYCSACGHEVRDRESVQSVSQLADKLAQLEVQKARITNRNGIFGQADYLNQINEINQQKANCIKAYPIPNNVEDIKEFVLLAATNVDPESYSGLSTRHNAQSSREVSDAWLAKCDQAMNKAHALMKGRREVDELQSVVDDAKEKIKRAKRNGLFKSVALFGGPWICVFGMLGILVLTGVIGPAAEMREQVRLEEIEKGILEDLEDGEYLRALLRADSLESSISDEMRQEWEINRGYWMDRVLHEAKESGVDLGERAEQLEAERLVEIEEESRSGFDKAQENIDEFNRIMAGKDETSQE